MCSNQHRYVLRPTTRVSTAVDASWEKRGQGGVVLRPLRREGAIDMAVLEGAQLRLARDSAITEVVDEYVVQDTLGRPLIAPAGAYWLSFRRLGYMAHTARVQIRAGAVDAIEVPLALARIC